MIYFPKDSIKVLFPTPGIPVMAIRFEVLDVGNRLIISCANFKSSKRLLSAKVIAFESA